MSTKSFHHVVPWFWNHLDAFEGPFHIMNNIHVPSIRGQVIYELGALLCESGNQLREDTVLFVKQIHKNLFESTVHEGFCSFSGCEFLQDALLKARNDLQEAVVEARSSSSREEMQKKPSFGPFGSCGQAKKLLDLDETGLVGSVTRLDNSHGWCVPSLEGLGIWFRVL